MSKKQQEDQLLAGPQAEVDAGYVSPQRPRRGYQRQSVGEAMAKSFIRSIASSLGRLLVRTLTRRMR
jgi:Bacterial protein of unknown function (DUF853)